MCFRLSLLMTLSHEVVSPGHVRLRSESSKGPHAAKLTPLIVNPKLRSHTWQFQKNPRKEAQVIQERRRFGEDKAVNVLSLRLAKVAHLTGAMYSIYIIDTMIH